MNDINNPDCNTDAEATIEEESPYESMDPWYLSLTDEGRIEYDKYLEDLQLKDERECGRSFSFGTSFDSSTVTCIKDKNHHIDAEYGNSHVGPNPLSEDNIFVVWYGGGYCAGDPLPRKVHGWSLEWDEEAYEEYVKECYSNDQTTSPE